MATTDNPLEPEITESGLAYMPALTTPTGDTIQVHDSSDAKNDHLWLKAREHDDLNIEVMLAVPMETALTFARQVIALGDRRGYRLDPVPDVDNLPLASAWDKGHEAGRICERLADRIGTTDSGHGAGCEDEYPNPYRAEAPTDGPSPDVIDGLVDELDTATDKLNAALPAPEGETRSDAGDILELGAYLATVHTAAALAERITRRIADLDITAYTADIGNHLDSAAEAARQRIRELATTPGDEDTPKVFPPRPYHLNSAGDYLTSLRTNALALAANAEAVLDEIECYLPTDEPAGHIPEYARDLLNGMTDTESE